VNLTLQKVHSILYSSSSLNTIEIIHKPIYVVDNSGKLRYSLMFRENQRLSKASLRVDLVSKTLRIVGTAITAASTEAVATPTKTFFVVDHL